MSAAERPGATRRQLLTAGAAGAGALLVPRPLAWAARRSAVPLAAEGLFSSGVASGEPTTNGITLWTRVEGLERTSKVVLEVASDPGFDHVVHRQNVRAAEVRDFTARARVAGRRLQPGERYWYRFETRRSSSPVGRFKTAVPADSNEPVRIGLFSCQRYENGYFTPQWGMAGEDDLDIVVALGDYVYDESFGQDVRFDPTGEEHGHAETLEQWRAKHRLYRSDAALQAMHAAHPFLGVWDDCEIEGDWAGDEESSNPGSPRDRSIPFLEKQHNAFNAYFEYMPFNRVRTSAAERFRIYRKVELGRNVDLFMLDTRQYRDPQPCENEQIFPCPDDGTPGRKMLGDTQKEWLKAGLVESRANWKVLGNAQMMMAFDVLGFGNGALRDAWDGYAAERKEVLEHAHRNGVRDLVSIVGDIHMFIAGDLTTNGRADGQPIGTEFVGSSVTHIAQEGILDPLPRDLGRITLDQLWVMNPHFKYINTTKRGYAVLEARQDDLTVWFKTPETVKQPRSSNYTLRSFRVQRGRPHVERN